MDLGLFLVQSRQVAWVTIMLSQTLGTALGDWTADTAGFGYLGAAAVLVFIAACLLFLKQRPARAAH